MGLARTVQILWIRRHRGRAIQSGAHDWFLHRICCKVRLEPGASHLSQIPEKDLQDSSSFGKQLGVFHALLCTRRPEENTLPKPPT